MATVEKIEIQINRDLPIRFAEWLLENDWHNHNGKWYNSSGWGITKTSSEMFDLFIKDNEL